MNLLAYRPADPPPLYLLGWHPAKRDSFDAVLEFCRSHERPTAAQAAAIRAELYDVFARLMRVRRISPTVDYSEGLWRLLRLVGLPDRSLRRREGRTA